MKQYDEYPSFNKYIYGNLYIPTTSTIATFSGTTLTIQGNLTNSIKSYYLEITGSNNKTINTLSINNMPLNAIYDVAIYNSGRGNVTIVQTFPNSNIKTTYPSNVIVAANRSALITIKYLSFPTIGNQYVVTAVLLN